jgi:hypothetical protein
MCDVLGCSEKTVIVSFIYIERYFEFMNRQRVNPQPHLVYAHSNRNAYL